MSWWRKTLSLIPGLALLFSPVAAESVAEAAPPSAMVWQSIGSGLTGELYGSPESVKPYKREGITYWGIMVKEVYREKNYLQELQKLTGHPELDSSMSFYLFQPKQKVFTITSVFYLNDKEEVLLQTTPKPNVGKVMEDEDAKNILLYIIQRIKQQKTK